MSLPLASSARVTGRDLIARTALPWLGILRDQVCHHNPALFLPSPGLRKYTASESRGGSSALQRLICKSRLVWIILKKPRTRTPTEMRTLLGQNTQLGMCVWCRQQRFPGIQGRTPPLTRISPKHSPATPKWHPSGILDTRFRPPLIGILQELC